MDNTNEINLISRLHAAFSNVGIDFREGVCEEC
ncbi:hypothetical protein MMC2321_01184 [Chitinophaga sp. MM2321]